LRHDLAPARDLGADETVELLGRGDAARDHAEIDDLLLNFGHCQDGGERRLQLAHDLLRRAGRHREHAPAGGVDSASGGLSGAHGERVFVDTPSTRTLPSRMSGSTGTGSENNSGTCPATTSVKAGALPL